jgi:flagellar assembly factor FliW
VSLKVTFEEPLFISLSGEDELQIEVLNPFVFRAKDNFDFVPRLTSIKAPIPV